MTSKTHLNLKKQKQNKEPNKKARGKGKQKVQPAGPTVRVNLSFLPAKATRET